MCKDTDKGAKIGTKEQPYGKFSKYNEQKYGRTHVGKYEYTDNGTIE